MVLTKGKETNMTAQKQELQSSGFKPGSVVDLIQNFDNRFLIELSRSIVFFFYTSK